MTGAEHRMRRRRDLLLGAVVLTVMAVLIIAGCSDSGSSGSSDAADHAGHHESELYEVTSGFDVLPAFLADYTENTAHRYAHAHEYADILMMINCYCGCMEYGTPHESLYRCYIAGTNADGSVRWTDHSANCGTCLMEFDDIVKMTDEGMSADDIRAAIDAKYAS